MQCPQCQHKIPLFSAERIFSSWIAKRCKQCGAHYRAQIPAPVAMVVGIPMVGLIWAAPAHWGMAYYLPIGIGFGLLCNMFSRLVPVKSSDVV
ncbi:hypothetical protein ACFOSD_06445 [Salinispirillum marinum]|uniref:DUF983 domain-containing protein n=2 Tax=Saccharospirillaceae TaxID=255527 RepID=A0ABV8BF27_9GAMM